MVGKIKIVFTPHLIDFLDDLVRLLYKKEYFGFIETAEEYVSKIYDSVPENLPLSTDKPTPQNLRYLGSYYIFTKPITELLGTFFLKDRISYS